jgi:hypothetical protein
MLGLYWSLGMERFDFLGSRDGPSNPTDDCHGQSDHGQPEEQGKQHHPTFFFN